jgi:hypothetical protein
MKEISNLFLEITAKKINLASIGKNKLMANVSPSPAEKRILTRSSFFKNGKNDI